MLRLLSQKILRILGIHPIVALRKGYLKEIGWHRSFLSKTSIDAMGEPIPWITYPAYHLLMCRSQPEWSVFEYGSGFSTLWWAKRVRLVTAVDHDATWGKRIAAMAPQNVIVIQVPLGEDYPRQAEHTGQLFDVVVIDGRMRVECIKAATPTLQPNGVIILDNSDRSDYKPGIDHLLSAGFRQLPLVGLAPGLTDATETSIFYRPGNVLGL
jgi:hypothetical protein